MVVCVNFDTNKIDIVSVPRDSLVWQYNYKGKAKANTAFKRGGG